MSVRLPGYLLREADELQQGHTVSLAVVRDAAALAQRMAEDILAVVRTVDSPTLIIPVGPVDQFAVLAERINRERVSLRGTALINMDEYLADDDAPVPSGHPLSFRGYMQRHFYDLLHANLAPPHAQRVFPDPGRPEAIGEFIRQRGGVDACFGGIGINGHIAFNEPPEPGETISDDEFADLPTRVLSLSRETRTINANTVGGSIEVVPRRCVTVGMREILASRELRLYCNRPWHSAVVRRVLLGPLSAACPASFVRRHPRGSLTMTEQVAARPDIRLR